VTVVPSASLGVGVPMAFTFFFRDIQVLDRAVECSIPIMAGRSYPRVWDAGCAMGPELYSLAILFAERMGTFGFNNLRLHATDLDECGQFEEIIRAGVYSEQEIERIPVEYRKAYFEPAGTPGYLRVVERVRSRIQFERHDLLSLKPVGEAFSLILCKNVLLHFSEPQRVAVLRMFHQALTSGGLLALEQTQKLPGELSRLFERIAADSQVFRKVDAC
jgi:chemotaxis protein methyltransferase CheR